ncbi:hypothetical protein B296_00025615, partial [Ensete ventricosum]
GKEEGGNETSAGKFLAEITSESKLATRRDGDAEPAGSPQCHWSHRLNWNEEQTTASIDVYVTSFPVSIAGNVISFGLFLSPV